MKNSTTLGLMVTLLMGSVAEAQTYDVIRKNHGQMLYPTVLIATASRSGLGTIIFGNSSDALFLYSIARKQYELIGVPSMVAGAGFAQVPHVRWSVPYQSIRRFLGDQVFGFVMNETNMVN